MKEERRVRILSRRGFRRGTRRCRLCGGLDEEAIDEIVESDRAETAGSSSSYKPIDAVATPKPVGLHEWLAAKTKM